MQWYILGTLLLNNYFDKVLTLYVYPPAATRHNLWNLATFHNDQTFHPTNSSHTATFIRTHTTHLFTAVKVRETPSKQDSLKEGGRLLYIHPSIHPSNTPFSVVCSCKVGSLQGNGYTIKSFSHICLGSSRRSSQLKPEMARLFNYVFILLAIGKSKFYFILSKTNFNLHFVMRLTWLCMPQLTVKVTAFQNRISKGHPVCWTELFQCLTFKVSQFCFGLKKTNLINEL